MTNRFHLRCGREWWRGALLGLGLMLTGTSTAHAQGRTEYYNVETPQVRPIVVARMANHDFLLVCNTPDNSVEVYDTDENITPASARFLKRIPVGLEPNSILFDPARKRFWVTCFLSDSVTTGVLTAPTGPGSLAVTLDDSQNVGNEPMDVALTPDGKTLLVTFNSQSSMGAFHPITLDPKPASAAFPAPTDDIHLLKTFGNQQRIINEPRGVEVFGNQAFVLNHKGGVTTTNTTANPNGYDFDLYSHDLTTGASTGLADLGSTNWNLRFAASGDLYVVGGEAQNHLVGDAVAQAPTGFVQHMLYRVRGAGIPGTVIHRRDLNTDGSGAPVAASDALAMPTDVEVIETDGQPTKVYVTAFGSDRVGVITVVNPNNASTWTIARIPIPKDAASTNPRSGPRAIVHKTPTGVIGDPGERLYVLNRLDNSVAILDPSGAGSHLETFALRQDPTPAYVRIGREFLYSADLSGNGFNSCASCHADGRTDAIGWNLGSPTGFSAEFRRGFVDSPSGATLPDLINLLNNGFDADKGVMITQTFQGLLDHEVDPAIQDLYSNAPYHWRGDRFTFTDFNEGFANLLGLGDNFGGGGPNDLPMGIPLNDMVKFEEFVNSIHYPPNPEQQELRVYTGDFGTHPDDPTDGSDGLRGMKIFHTVRLPNSVGGGRSCVQCHALGSGSNFVYTDSIGNVPNAPQPLETAQLRGLHQREPAHQADGDDLSTAIKSGMFGLTHNGGRGTINTFNNLFQGSMTLAQRLDLNRFVHEFDTGTAPIVGRSQPVSLSNVGLASTSARLATFEGQVALANAGLAVQGWITGMRVGYWYDPVGDVYVDESSAGQTSVSRAALLALVTGSRDRLFFRSTPLGNDRRVASLSGSSSSFPLGTPPANLKLQPLGTNTAWSLVPQMTGNWIPLAQGGTFVWQHATDPNVPTPRFARAVRQLQYGLIDPANQVNHGLSALRHDAPRRFRIAGDGILSGAHLVLWTPNDSSGTAPDIANPPDTAKTRRLELPIFPTGQTAGGQPVWETAAELSPLQYSILMNGGKQAPGVKPALDDVLSQLPEPPPSGTFNPDGFNWHYVEVINPNGQSANGGWQRLSL